MSGGDGEEMTTIPMMMTTIMMKVKSSAVAEGRLEVLQIYKLLQLVREGNKAQVEKMVRLGVPNLINLTEPNEGTGVLHLTSISNNLDMAEVLLSLGAHPDVQDKRGRTPAILATELGHDAMLVLLAKNQADMNLVDNDGKGTLGSLGLLGYLLLELFLSFFSPACLTVQECCFIASLHRRGTHAACRWRSTAKQTSTACPPQGNRCSCSPVNSPKSVRTSASGF